jgi:hypothetical protein
MIIEWGGAQLTMEMIEFVGFAFAAMIVAALVHEHRKDVLHSPYIKGSDRREGVVMKRLAMAPATADRLRWRARNMIYLTSIIAC